MPQLAKEICELLECPRCRSGLIGETEVFRCGNAACATRYPVVNGIPILINEDKSIFRIADFVEHGNSAAIHAGPHPSGRGRITPSIDRNVKARANFDLLATKLLETGPRPRVLVIGGAIVGAGMEALADNSAFELIETDVWFGPRTKLVCDAHDIPFRSDSFDAVIIQAVLEHVLDPHRCVEELHRILKPQGFVYAETPFMQQVHMGRHDFTRFTHLGHRRLFRKFDELDSGAVCGPGMALAWAFRYFLLSFTESRFARWLAYTTAAWCTFFLKYFDGCLINKPAALDAASGVYFLGRKSERVLSDRDLLGMYRGMK